MRGVTSPPIRSLIHSRLPSRSTFHSLISHFPLQSFSPLFGPIIFVCALLLLLSLCSSPFIYSIISHLHSVSFLFMLLSRLMHMLLFLWNVFYPLPSLVCFCHHHVQLPSGLLSLRNPSVRQQINCNYLIINIVVESEVQVGDTARTGEEIKTKPGTCNNKR